MKGLWRMQVYDELTWDKRDAVGCCRRPTSYSHQQWLVTEEPLQWMAQSHMLFQRQLPSVTGGEVPQRLSSGLS